MSWVLRAMFAPKSASQGDSCDEASGGASPRPGDANDGTSGGRDSGCDGNSENGPCLKGSPDSDLLSMV